MRTPNETGQKNSVSVYLYMFPKKTRKHSTLAIFTIPIWIIYN